MLVGYAFLLYHQFPGPGDHPNSLQARSVPFPNYWQHSRTGSEAPSLIGQTVWKVRAADVAQVGKQNDNSRVFPWNLVLQKHDIESWGSCSTTIYVNECSIYITDTTHANDSRLDCCPVSREHIHKMNYLVIKNKNKRQIMWLICMEDRMYGVCLCE